jgi:YVTN family beta-propeller protein
MPSNSPPRQALRLPAAAALPFLLVAACGRNDARRPTTDSTAATAQPAEPPAKTLLAYVTNEDSQDLTVIDTRTDSVVATIPVGTRPRGVRVSPDGKTIFVALSGSPKCPPSMPDAECEKLKADKSKDGIAVVDAAARKVTRVLPGGSDPEAFDLSHDGGTLFVSNEDAGTASILDVASGKIRATVPVGKEPEGVRVQPDGKAVWVTGETDHNVTILDTQTGKVLGQVEVGRRPRSLAFTPDGARAYVTSEIDGTVWVLDAAARKRIAVLTLPKDSKTMGSAASPDGKRIYVSNGRGGTISVIDVATDSVTATVPVGQRPWGIAVTPDGRKLYTANGPSNDVSVVDADRLTVEKKIPVGKIPWGVALGKAP